MIKRVAFYARSATAPQVGPNSAIVEQRQNVSAYCRLRGWLIVAEYIDAPASGITDDRPDFRRMVEDAMAGRFDVIVVESRLRLFRDVFLLELHRRRFEAAGVEIVSICDHTPDNPDLPFRALVLADILAEREGSRLRSMRIKRGIAAKKLREGGKK